MIEYREFRFYVDGEPVNREHEGLTLLDVCERLMLCPISVAHGRTIIERGHHSWLSDDNSVLVYEDSKGAVINDQLILDSLKLISEFRYTETGVSGIHKLEDNGFAFWLEMRFENNTNRKIILSELHTSSDDKVFHGFFSKMMLGNKAYTKEAVTARLVNIDRLADELGLKEVIKANIAVEALC